MSGIKRTSYVSETDSSTSDDENYLPPCKRQKLSKRSENTDAINSSALTKQFQYDGFQNLNVRRPKRVPKVFSKNALMARENRVKKKLYVENLERQVQKLKDENKKYSKVVENQSFFINELKNEVKYLKSVIANSADISKLIRNVSDSTGMLVSSSLSGSMTLNCVSKRTHPVARKTAHPWEENDVSNYPSPESSPPVTDIYDAFPLIESDHDYVNGLESISEILPDLDVLAEGKTEEVPIIPVEDEDDVGVCLHLSKHRVSLEFCSTCSESSVNNWKKLEMEDVVN